MKFYWTLILFVLCNICYCQADTSKRIYIYGAVRDKGGKNTFNSKVFLKGTKIIYQANDDGLYKLDITKIADTCRTYIVKSGYVLYQTSEVIIKGKIKSSIKVDIELIYGDYVYTNITELKVKSGKKVIVVKKQTNFPPNF